MLVKKASNKIQIGASSGLFYWRSSPKSSCQHGNFWCSQWRTFHQYNISVMASQITIISNVCWTVGHVITKKKKNESAVLLIICGWNPLVTNEYSSHKWPVMCPFYFRWLKGYIYGSCYYHHQIGSINLTHFITLFRSCVPETFVKSYSVTYCTYITENREFVFIIIAQFMMSANRRVRFGLQIESVCLYITPSPYQHSTNISEDIELIKCLSSVWVRFSQLSIIQYMGLCVSVYPFPLWWLTEYIYFVLLSSSNRKHELLSIVQG